MSECIYLNSKYKILNGYDGFQVWEKCSVRYDIWFYVRTFKVLAQAVKFIEVKMGY